MTSIPLFSPRLFKPGVRHAKSTHQLRAGRVSQPPEKAPNPTILAPGFWLLPHNPYTFRHKNPHLF